MNGCVDDIDSEAESPTSLLWTLSYLAQHFDYVRQTDRALEYVNAALAHTMTLIELYVIKARIYKVRKTSVALAVTAQHDILHCFCCVLNMIVSAYALWK